MTWSADVPSDDWRGIGSAEIVRRTMSRLEAKGRGILLFHDIHEHTVEALPEILKELKLKGYKVAQIVPVNATIAKSATTPEQWRLAPTQAAGENEKAPSAAAFSSAREAAKEAMATRGKEPTRMTGARRARKHSHPVAGGRAGSRHVRDFGCGAPSRAQPQLVPCVPSHRRVI
jgi:uroporphyrinogen-III decarboxylase